MKLVPAPDIVVWLNTEWSGQYEWDAGNTTKLAKHNFTTEQVEELFAEDFAFLGEAVDDKFNERRFVVCGQLQNLKYMTVAWTNRADKIRPISCRSARNGEKRSYHKIEK